MIRQHYALPEVEKDCNTVCVDSVRWVGTQIILETSAGNADHSGGAQVEIEPDRTVTIGADVDPQTWKADPEVRPQPQYVDTAAFEAWYEGWYVNSPHHNPNDWTGQRLHSGLMLYAWLQREALLPTSGE